MKKRTNKRAKVASPRRRLYAGPFFDFVVRDDAMSPTFIRDDHVTIDSRVATIANNGIYLINWTGQRLLTKHVQIVRCLVTPSGVLFRFDNDRYDNERDDYIAAGGGFHAPAQAARLGVLGRALLIKRIIDRPEPARAA